MNMRKPYILYICILLFLMLTINVILAFAEQSAWDCPKCGRTGNTGNYCGGCAHPAPWLESEKSSQHDAYMAAELESPVEIETYVQATQSWWDNKITVYAQDAGGAYFIYNMACSEEDASKLVPGTKIRVKGYKGEWAGEIEIVDGTFEILEGDPYFATAADLTNLLGTAGLIVHQNERVLFRGLKVKAQADGEPINFKNAADKTDDIYVSFENADGQIFNFCVEFYLTDDNTDVYKAVAGLQIGDVVDVEGFLYWYNDANLHITGITRR